MGSFKGAADTLVTSVSKLLMAASKKRRETEACKVGPTPINGREGSEFYFPLCLQLVSNGFGGVPDVFRT